MQKQILAGVVSLALLTGCAGRMPELGITNGQLSPCPKTPNCVNSQVIGEKQKIQPILFKGSPQEARARLLETLDSLERVKIVATAKDYVRAEFTSALLRFVDDVEFYFPDEQATKTVIHVRSASRIGRSDFGANRKRVERIRGLISK